MVRPSLLTMLKWLRLIHDEVTLVVTGGMTDGTVKVIMVADESSVVYGRTTQEERKAVLVRCV